MVDIKILFLIILIFLLKQANASQSISIIRDAEIEFYLHKIIQATIDKKTKTNLYYPRLVSSDEYNAFVTGSNKIYINTGLIKKANSLSEIQGIIAHEIGHLVLNHHNSRSINTRSLSNYSKFASIAGIALSAVGKLDTNSAIGLIVGSKDLATKSSLQFSRIQEQEADKFALDMMRKKQIPFDGLELLLLNLSNEEASGKTSLRGYYRSHPFSKQRLDQLKKYKANIKYSPKKIQNILINNNKVSLKYIKNKIQAYNSEPYKILKNKDSNDIFLYNYSRVIAFYKIGKYDLANKHLKILENEYKNYPYFFELSGDIYYKKGNFKKAIEEYKKAIKTVNGQFSPSSDLIKFSLVKSYIQTNKQNNINESIIILEQLIHNSPKWGYLWRLLAKSSSKVNRKGISYIALAEEALIKKNFIKAKKYVDLANKQSSIPSSYKLRGADIVARIKMKK